MVENLQMVMRGAGERISRFAYFYARRAGRQKVTIVHQANIMKLSDGLFLDTARRIGRPCPDIQTEDSIVDNTCMRLALNWWRFDHLLLENLHGDIIPDLTAGLVGGLGGGARRQRRDFRSCPRDRSRYRGQVDRQPRTDAAFRYPYGRALEIP